MDKIKNLVNPGSKKDDEVMYGTGVSDDPVHSGGSGIQSSQGHHLGSGHSTGNDPLSSSTHPTSGTSGLRDTTGKNPLSTSTNPTGSSQYDTTSSGRGTHGLNEPYASRMPGGFDDDAATTASVRSGVPGKGTHTGSGTTGVYDPNITNKPLPNEPTAAGARLPGSSYNNSGAGNSLTGNNYPDRSVDSSGFGDQTAGSSRLGRDAAVGAGAVGAGAAAHHHQSTQRDNYVPETARSFPLSGNSSTETGSAYSSGQSGSKPFSGSTTAGPHSSNLANKADPRVDSDLDSSRTAGQTGYGLGTGSTPGLGHQGSLGHDAAIGAGTGAGGGVLASDTSGYGPQSWDHEHGRHGHQYEGDPCGTGEIKSEGIHLVPGPHATDTANRLDPHVAGGVGQTEAVSSHHGAHGHRAETAGVAGGAGGSALGVDDSSRGQQGTTPGATTGAGYGSSSTDIRDPSAGPAPNTAGPHKSDMLNKLDPRVDSDLSKQGHKNIGADSSGLGSSTSGTTDPYSSQGTGHHHSQETAVGGAGLAGAAAYEGDKHHRRNEPNLAESTSGIGSRANPYSSSAIDPRVGSGRSGLDSTPTTGTGRGNHSGRDAGLGAGAGGLAHGAERHHGQPSQATHIPTGSTGSAHPTIADRSAYDQAGSRIAGSSQQPATTKDHHYGRDAALGAGVGGAAYEAEKHHGRDSSGIASTPQGQLAGSGHQPQSTHTGHHTSSVGGGNTGVGPDTENLRDYDQHAGRNHHLGRNAAVGGAALGAGAGAAGVDEHSKFRETGRMDPGTTLREHQHPGDSVATYPSSGHGNERQSQDPSHHGDRKEEEVLAGGAAAGGLAHHEHSKKEEKTLEKEHAKEVKQHEKELAKEEKALEKDQKAHEKERAKHLAAIEKDHKKHEHDAEKHAHDGEKKKGGLLGFLHRDKPDKDLKEEEARRQVSGNVANRQGDGELSAGAGASSYADPLAGEHGSQSGVHDTPIGMGTTTHDAYKTQDGHNKLHKDPPAKILEARGQDYQGHGNVS